MANQAQVQQQVRFALTELRERNGHHTFGAVCWHLAKSRITPDLLPATGPVGADGDQGPSLNRTSDELT